MPIYVSAGDSKPFEPAPEGLWPIVCCDVVDLGEVATQWGKKQKVQLRWQLGNQAGVRDDGKPWLVIRTFTASLREKAELTKCLVRWRKKAFTSEELQRFALETVIGAVGLGNIVHNTLDDGRVFANVDTIVPLPKEMVRPTIRDYVRQKDRTQVSVEPPDEELFEAENTVDPMPSQGDIILPKLIDMIQQLGYASPTVTVNKTVATKYPGKDWKDLTDAQKMGLLDIAKKMLDKKLKAELDAQANTEGK